MADLSIFEQMQFETLFGMEGGYVLDFSNRSFQAFIATCTGIDVYDEKYNYYSGSKANRLRAFWKEESNHIVGKLLLDLLEYWKTKKLTAYSGIEPAEQALFDECYAIADRLHQDTKLENIDVIQPYSEERDFAWLTDKKSGGKVRTERLLLAFAPLVELDIRRARGFGIRGAFQIHSRNQFPTAAQGGFDPLPPNP